MFHKFVHYFICGLKYLFLPRYRFIIDFNRGRFDSLPDEFFLKKIYRFEMGKDLDLANPKTFNEKVQWLKINDRNPRYTIMADKIAVKDYVASILGTEYIVPLLAVWDNAEDITIDELPDKFVLKCNHDGGLIVCKDKKGFDIDSVRKILAKRMKRNYYFPGRGWQYKNIIPKVFAEEFVENDDGADPKSSLVVYKFFSFNGEPRIIQVIQNDKKSDETIDYFDTEWNLLDLRQNFPNSDVHLQKPQALSKMLDIVRQLSKGMIFIRVDLYYVRGRILFSEFTFHSDSGLASFSPEKWDYELGSYMDISGLL